MNKTLPLRIQKGTLLTFGFFIIIGEYWLASTALIAYIIMRFGAGLR